VATQPRPDGKRRPTLFFFSILLPHSRRIVHHRLLSPLDTAPHSCSVPSAGLFFFVSRAPAALPMRAPAPRSPAAPASAPAARPTPGEVVCKSVRVSTVCERGWKRGSFSVEPRTQKTSTPVFATLTQTPAGPRPHRLTGQPRPRWLWFRDSLQPCPFLFFSPSSPRARPPPRPRPRRRARRPGRGQRQHARRAQAARRAVERGENGE
jgi:hypothetical protein